MMKKYGIGLLLAVIMTVCMTGCGTAEAVHTSAETQGSEDIEDEQQEELIENAAQAANETENTNASVAQTEIDEETRNQLTAELLQEQQMDTSVMENTRTTKGCTFTLPDSFEDAEDMPGMYVTKRYPIDASTIYYTEREQDVSLQLMTEETFKTQTEADFASLYDEEVEVVIDSFERIQIEGYPAFRILCHYEVDGVEITQLEYAINADKSYVIIYSQTGEYDRMEEYEASAETIRLEY